MELLDICEFIVDCPHSTARDEGVGIPLIRTPNVGKGRLVLDGVHRVSMPVYKDRISRAIPSENDLILAREAPVGNVAIITKGQTVCLGQRVVLIRPQKDVAYPSFLVYYLLSPEIQHKLINSANGAVVSHLNVADIRKLKVSLPPYDQQKKIGDILSSLDNKIELNNKINAQLEEMAQAIFKNWFVDFEPFKDGKFVESEMGMIPEGWNVISFTDILTASTQKVGREGVPEFSVTNTGIHPRDEKFNKNLSKSSAKNKLLRKGNLVFGMSREILNWGVMKEPEGGVSSAYNIYIVDDSKVNIIYLENFIKSHMDYFHDLIKPASREGQGLDKNALMSKFVYIPRTDVLDTFLEKYNAIRAKIELLKKENLHLSNLRDTLLPKLMSGEIEFS